MPQSEWWMFVIDALAGFSAVAVAIFAGVEIWRGRKVTARANAEVGANAAALRHQLQGVADGPWYQLPGAARDRAVKLSQDPFPKIEERAVRMVAAAGAAGETFAGPARDVLRMIYSAMDATRAAARAAPHPRAAEAESAEIEHLKDARELLEQAIARLGDAMPRGFDR